MSPAQVDPGSQLTTPSGYRQLKPEKKEDIRTDELGTDMGDIITFCAGACQNGCHLRVEWEEVMSCSSGSKTRRYRKRGSPKPLKGDVGTAMEMTLSPVCRMFSSPSDSKGYHTRYTSDCTDVEPDFLAGRSHTTQKSKLALKTERESVLQSAAITRVPRHTEFAMMGLGPMGEARDVEEDPKMNADGTGDPVMGGGEERAAPGNPPQDSCDPERDAHHPHEVTKDAGCR